MTRSEVLDHAKACVCGDREAEYGTPENNFRTIANLWNTYIRTRHKTWIALDAKDVAVMMGLLKIARIATGNSTDSYVDLAGYAACAAEVATEQESED